MVQCCVCPWEKCSEDCPALDVLPFEGPKKEESIRKVHTLQAAGMEFDQIRENLRDAGSVDAKNELINKWVEEYESREKDDLYHIIRNRVIIMQKKREIEEKQELLAKRRNFLAALKTVLKVDDEETAPPVAAHEGRRLPGLKKCTNNNNNN